MTKTTTVRMKSGPYAGGEAYPAVKQAWNQKQYSLDTRAPWRTKISDCIADAISLGWRWEKCGDTWVLTPQE